ncbi:phage replisome organizer N-terminal domain-containing protein [Enterococcus faecium]|uniref:phage replisome organizer N-terminal domain-containing protein n=1 Tax=Enterococcus faecium TaxID=1352 RepID=UPI00177C73B8|nr:phage replisome organizer N-terminal domain-containing protein [Enterococcus faecium]MBD9766510.1 phage replisome organizer N-terminal domain-containing protein [Enterococcus faecium]
MSDKQKKRYYWLKLKEDFFEEDTIEWLEEQPNGKEYCLFYLKLCLKSLKTEGILVRNVGNLMIPYDPESLAKLTNSNTDTVKVAMDLFNKIGLIKILDSGEIYLNQLSELVGSETEYARQKRIQRAKEDNVQKLSGKGRLEIELEKDIDIDIDIDIDKEEKKGKYSDEHLRLAKKMQSNLTEDFPKEMNKVDIEKWADTIRLMEERDKASIEAIEYVINWLPTNEFWFGNIRSAKKLREKFEKLKFEIKADKKNHKKQSQKLQYSNPSEYDDLPI